MQFSCYLSGLHVLLAVLFLDTIILYSSLSFLPMEEDK